MSVALDGEGKDLKTPSLSPEEIVDQVAEQAPELEQQEKIQEVISEQEEETPEADEAVLTEASTLSKEEIVSRLSEAVEGVVDEVKGHVESLKQAYYKFRRTELEALKAKFLEDGGTEDSFEPTPDSFEDQVKQLLTKYKEKRARFQADVQRVQQENMAAKEALLADLQRLTESADDVSKHYPEFQEIQKKWKEIVNVPPAQLNDLWKRFHHEVEKFYELLKINNELREYDFKVNLGLKLALCEAAEKLAEEEDVISAFHQLQKLHEEWKEIGPVSKTERDTVWNRFKEASTVINKRHQTHFESLKSREQANEEAKTVLCEKAEAILEEPLDNFSAWDEKTRFLLELQQEWKTYGFAPKKSNNLLYDRFRAACNLFFEKKAAFYDAVKENMAANLARKNALCEQAEALMNSQEWKSTTDKLIALQKEWKQVGAVARKQSDAVWNRFVAACDHFFEEKEKFFSANKSIEQENLKAKQDVIAALIAITEEDEAEQAAVQVRELMAKWNSIGHVPFKEKDKIYKAYNAQLDRHFKRLNVRNRADRMQRFSDNLDGMSDEKQMFRERDRLLRHYDSLKSELKTIENNMGFFTASSKSGGSLLKEMDKKVQRLKDDIKATLEKIDLIDSKINPNA